MRTSPAPIATPGTRVPRARWNAPVFLRALCLVLLGILVACGDEAPGASKEARSSSSKSPAVRNVVLISIDTLRADHLGAYGYGPATSPRLDAFAARAVLFKNVTSASGHTLSSHKAMLSGRYPSSLLAAFSKNGGPPHATSSELGYYQAAMSGWPTPSLARRLKDAGLATIGLTDGGYMQAQFGFGDGFDEYRSARVGLARHRSKAEDWIVGNSGKPFFLLLHGYDVHCPYMPPDAYLKKFEAACTGRLRFDGTCGKDYFNTLDLTAEDKAHITRHYDAGILHADDEVGKFLDFLEKEGRFKDTVIVITSDHGESLGERAFVGHGELFENQLHVPLIVYAPGLKPAVVTAPVSGVDVTPTILDLVLGKVPGGLDGWSLRGLMETASRGAISTAEFAARPRVASITVNEGRGYATRLRKLAIEAGGVKMLVDLDSGERQLYDLRADPAESKNLAKSGRLEEARLLRVAREHDPGVLKGFDPTGRAHGDEPLTPEMRDELKSLGYVN